MAWPKDLNDVACIGFPRGLLNVLRNEIDNKQVKWDKNSVKMFLEFASATFEFADCVWQLEESNEYVRTIKLISGSLDSEHLTALVLRG